MTTSKAQLLHTNHIDSVQHMAFGRQKVRRDPKDFAEKSANLPENETLSAHLKNNFPFLFVVTASAVRTTKVVTTNLFVDAYLGSERSYG